MADFLKGLENKAGRAPTSESRYNLIGGRWEKPRTGLVQRVLDWLREQGPQEGVGVEPMKPVAEKGEWSMPLVEPGSVDTEKYRGLWESLPMGIKGEFARNARGEDALSAFARAMEEDPEVRAMFGGAAGEGGGLLD